MPSPPALALVIPAYNEESVLPETKRRVLELLERLAANDKTSPESCVYFVDDGSSDRTWELIEAYAAEDARVRGIKLSRNRGHQNALVAGLFNADGDAVISIDADLQDDLNVAEQMVDAYAAGSDIVFGVRKGRVTDSPFKRHTAHMYYRILNWMGVQAIYNHADYRLPSRRAIDALKE